MKRLVVILFIAVIPISGQTQEKSTILTQDQLLWYVKKYHPVSVQSNLLNDKGEREVQKARGGFDPYVASDFNQKYYNDKTYYSLLSTGLTVPTWYGIELKTGYDQNSGVFLNDQNYLPSEGLWQTGISVPVGSGLFFDERRATLKSAKIFAESTEAAQVKILNDLYFSAITHYWKWAEAWNQLTINESAVQLAETRFEAVKSSYEFGDRPAIDTLEAFIQIQNRSMNRNQSLLSYQNATLELSNFLWFENNTPLEITQNLVPPATRDIQTETAFTRDSLDLLVSQLEYNHPDMLLYDYKLQSIGIEERLKKEGLKPKIDLKYNILNEPLFTDAEQQISTQNYTWGVSFSIPLFFREKRGDLQLTKIKIKETELDQQSKLLELENKVKTYFNKLDNLQQQLALYRDALTNYDNLLKGERTKFNTGESSLFLVNSREINYIQAQLKLTEITTKYMIAKNGLDWAAGRITAIN